jgi:hypothetical protein
MGRLINWVINFGRRQAKRLLAVGIILGLFFLAQLPVLSKAEKNTIAEHFAFSRLPLPQVMMGQGKQERVVNPHLVRHSGWISAVGAAIALNDLDGDGLPNDLCQVEPRTDQIIVAPVPGSGNRYQPFIVISTKGETLGNAIRPNNLI